MTGVLLVVDVIIGLAVADRMIEIKRTSSAWHRTREEGAFIPPLQLRHSPALSKRSLRPHRDAYGHGNSFRGTARLRSSAGSGLRAVGDKSVESAAPMGDPIPGDRLHPCSAGVMGCSLPELLCREQRDQAFAFLDAEFHNTAFASRSPCNHRCCRLSHGNLPSFETHRRVNVLFHAKGAMKSPSSNHSKLGLAQTWYVAARRTTRIVEAAGARGQRKARLRAGAHPKLTRTRRY
jgi:hypothetical protein